MISSASGDVATAATWGARTAARCAITGLLALSAVVLLPFEASAVQASGSVLVTPDHWGLDFEQEEERVDITIRVTNSSTDTPASKRESSEPVEARLREAVMVDLSCADPTCTSRLAVVPEFVSVGARGCVKPAAAVQACEGDESGMVSIVLDPEGLIIPPGASVELATIRVLYAPLEIGLREFQVSAFSLPGALSACASSSLDRCAYDMVSGSALLAVQAIVPQIICVRRGACRGRISFVGSTTVPDRFFLQAEVMVTTPIVPATDAFRIVLSRSRSSTVFDLGLPPGSLKSRSDGGFAYRNPNAAAGGGISAVVIRPLPSGIWSVEIAAYSAALQARATANMVLQYSIGNDLYTKTDVWTRTSSGWVTP